MRSVGMLATEADFLGQGLGEGFFPLRGPLRVPSKVVSVKYWAI